MKDIFEKWSPIMDVLKVTDERLRNIMIEYAEKKQNEVWSMTVDSTQQNLLPTSLMILSKLNLKNKNLIFQKGLKPITFNVDLSSGEMELLLHMGNVDMVAYIENIVTKTITDYINDKLQTNNNLYVTTIANSFSLISEKTMKPSLVITSRILIK